MPNIIVQTAHIPDIKTCLLDSFRMVLAKDLTSSQKNRGGRGEGEGRERGGRGEGEGRERGGRGEGEGRERGGRGEGEGRERGGRGEGEGRERGGRGIRILYFSTSTIEY